MKAQNPYIKIFCGHKCKKIVVFNLFAFLAMFFVHINGTVAQNLLADNFPSSSINATNWPNISGVSITNSSSNYCSSSYAVWSNNQPSKYICSKRLTVTTGRDIIVTWKAKRSSGDGNIWVYYTNSTSSTLPYVGTGAAPGSSYYGGVGTTNWSCGTNTATIPASSNTTGYMRVLFWFSGVSTTIGSLDDISIDYAAPPCTNVTTVTVTPNPASVCNGSNFTFTATPDGDNTNRTYQWQRSTSAYGSTYSNVSGATNSTYTFTQTTTGYRYRCIVTNCSGASVTSAYVALTVSSLPLEPIATTPINYCQGATSTQLSASGTGLLWYTTSTGGTGSSTAPTPSTSTPGTTHYYVSQTIGGCESQRKDITVVVNSIPSAPSATTPITYTQGSAATPLTASGTNLL